MHAGLLEAIWVKRARRGVMDAVDSVELVENRGLADSADQGGRRQVTIIEQEVWAELMRQFGASLPPVTRRANLMVRDIMFANMRGKVLCVGDCRIRIYGETKPCERMDEALPGLKDAMYPDWRGGAFGEVIGGGVIKLGDLVAWEV